ncbi:MAG: tetratricopeptide repeat protein [Planctomycetota bacterium]
MPRPAALALLVSSLVAQSERPPEGFQLAVGMQQRLLHEEAARAFEQFVASNGSHALAAEARYRLGQCRQELQQVDAAIAAFESALAKGGTGFALRSECRYRLGNLLEQKQDHRGALAQFTALADETAGEHYLAAAARFAAGEACCKLGDDEQAVSLFASAAEHATGERQSYQFSSLYQLGFARFRLQQWTEAASAFAGAGKAAPDDAAKGECAFLAGDALLRGGEHDAAAKAFTRAQNIDSEFADDAAHGLGFVAVARGDRAAAARAFGVMIERFPESPLVPQARLERGRALYQDGKHDAAAAELNTLLAGDGAPPLRQQAQELLGLCALATGDGEAAVASLQTAIQSASAAEKPRLTFALGEALANLSRWDEAVVAYDAVPQDAAPELRGDAVYGACYALHAAGRHQDSIARAQRVVAMTPPHRLRTEALLALAENHFALQQYEIAEASYLAVGDAPALTAMVAWKLAWCRYLRGDKKDAGARFAAIAEDAKSPHKEEALSMQALSLLEAGLFDEALAASDRYRARHRDGSFVDRTERVAARVLRQKGDLQAARQRLDRAAAAAKARGSDGDASGDQLEQAELAFQQGDFRAADRTFQLLVSRDDELGARACAGRAWCAFELGDDDACVAALTTAKSHSKATSELPHLLELESALRHRQQDWAAAIVAAEQFLRSFATHEKAKAMRYSLGIAQARASDHKSARKTLAALLKDGGGDRSDRVAYELAWSSQKDGDEPAALAAFAIAAKSEDVEIASESKLHLGLAALQKKDLATARTFLVDVQGQNRGRALYRLAFAEFEAAPSDSHVLATARDRFLAVAAMEGEALATEARYMTAECCHRLADDRAAVAACEELLRKDASHERADRARMLLGECALALGEHAKVIEALEPFVRKKDRDRTDLARANLWLGRARQKRGEHEAAESAFVVVTEQSDGPLAAEAQFRIGEGRLAKNDVRGAADAFVKLPILYADATWVRQGLLQAGLCYERLDQVDKAQRFFRELIEKHEPSKEAATAREHVRSR